MQAACWPASSTTDRGSSSRSLHGQSPCCAWLACVGRLMSCTTHCYKREVLVLLQIAANLRAWHLGGTCCVCLKCQPPEGGGTVWPAHQLAAFFMCDTSERTTNFAQERVPAQLRQSNPTVMPTGSCGVDKPLPTWPLGSIQCVQCRFSRLPSSAIVVKVHRRRCNAARSAGTALRHASHMLVPGSKHHLSRQPGMARHFVLIKHRDGSASQWHQSKTQRLLPVPRRSTQRRVPVSGTIPSASPAQVQRKMPNAWVMSRTAVAGAAAAFTVR